MLLYIHHSHHRGFDNLGRDKSLNINDNAEFETWLLLYVSISYISPIYVLKRKNSLRCKLYTYMENNKYGIRYVVQPKSSSGSKMGYIGHF